MSQKEIYIEKFEADSIEHEPVPFVQIRREVIQNIKNPLAALIWIYLQSLPPTWKPNKHQLMKHFDISARTYERHMAFLCASGLIVYRRVRHKNGTLGKVKLIALNGDKFNLSPNSKHRAQFEIVKDTNHTAKYDGLAKKVSNPNDSNGFEGVNHTAKKPLSGEPTAVVRDAHINKQSNKEKKENKKNNINTIEAVINTKADAVLLEDRKKFLPKDDLERTEEEYLRQCSHFLDSSDKNQYNFTRRLAGLRAIIRKGFFEKPAGYDEKKIIKSTYTPEDQALIATYQHALRMEEAGMKMEIFFPDPKELKKVMALMEKLNKNKPSLTKRFGNIMGFNSM